MLHQKLSDLTPAVVDSLYNIDGATPVAEPIFLFLLGVPGSGKSSGHAYAPPGPYATINVDLLLESLLPFRAASSIAHYLKRQGSPVKFSSIGAYGTRKENLGLFKWYDDADPQIVQKFNRIREEFLPLLGQETTHSLNDLTSEALARAIQKHVNIVYETTASVKKVDDIMSFIKKHKAPYSVRFIHIKASAEDIAARLRARQEHGMPQERFPFYRYVPPHMEKLLAKSEEAFAALRKKYAKVATFEEIENPLDPARLPAENRRSASTRRRHILAAYGPLHLSSSPRPDLYISPTTSEKRRRSTQKRKTSTK
jgi:shikimate kinase